MIKKKLFTMAMAASMVLPTHLVAMSTLTTSVLADEFKDGIEVTELSQNDFEERGGFTYLNPGNYKVSSSSTLPSLNKPIWILGQVTIDLAPNTKISSTAPTVFGVLKGSSLIITGSGTIETSASGDNTNIIQMSGNGAQLIIGGANSNDSVKLVGPHNGGYGILLQNSALASEIKLYNTEIDTKYSGVYVNGSIEPGETDIPSIELNKVNIHSDGCGIYQAGMSNITVNGGSITGDSTGIETRAGSLKVTDGAQISGGTGNNTTVVQSNNNGTTTTNAGISIAQHRTKKPITVDIENSDISGNTALVIANPENNTLDTKNVSIELENTFLKGTTSSLGCALNITNIVNNINLKENIYSHPNLATLTTFEGSLVSSNTAISTWKSENLTVQYTQKTKINSYDISFEDGPYSINGRKGPETISVRGLTDQEYSHIYIYPGKNENEPTTGGIAVLKVTPNENNSKGYDSTPAQKEYILLDDNGNTLNIVFNPTDSNGNAIRDQVATLDIPLKPNYFSEGLIDNSDPDNPTLTENLSDEELSKALNKWSNDTTYGDSGSSVAPFYKYTVSGFENSVQLQAPTIEVTLDNGSYICLAINQQETARILSDFSEMIEVNSENSMISEDSAIVLEDAKAVESTHIYVKVDALDKNNDLKITQEEVKAYIDSNAVPGFKSSSVEFPTLDLTTPFVLGADGFSVNEDGYYVISAEASPVSTGSSTGSTGGHTGGGGGGSTAQKPKPEEPKPTTPVIGTPTSMYRLYNRLTGEHLYTMDKKERDELLTSNTWQDEGEGWIAPSVSDYPVYRLLNPNTSDHHYTMDKNEFDTLPSLGWVAEGVAFFSADKDDENNVILYRLYNPNAKGAGIHHYTTDEKERDTLVSMGWKYEGLAWAGLPAQK